MCIWTLFTGVVAGPEVFLAGDRNVHHCVWTGIRWVLLWNVLYLFMLFKFYIKLMHIHVFKSLYNTYSCYSKLCINLIRNHVILKFVYKDDTYLRYSKVHIKLIWDTTALLSDKFFTHWLLNYFVGHLDSRKSIQRVLLVTSCVALMYSCTQVRCY